MNITHQKYLVMAVLLAANVSFIGLFLHFDQYWYAFLAVLALATTLNAFSALLVLLSRMVFPSPAPRRRPKRNYIYVMPCYDESKDELAASIQALARQRTMDGDTYMLVILCDGVARTVETLKQILGIGAAREERYAYELPPPLSEMMGMSVFRGMYQADSGGSLLPFVLCAKDKNQGKRESLVLVRRLCLRYNNNGTSWIFGRVFWGQKIDYIIGLDADTVLHDECAYHLIEGIERDSRIYGCVGYVDVAGGGGGRRFSPFNWYQYAEYMFAQCLKRQAQSCITGKVSCLSGCNQILRVSEETCGEDLLKIFHRRPEAHESIFTQIRGYASEDRNHVGLMLSMYPYVRTTQALQATAYTQVPQSVSVFLSQRRRWNLGAAANDMLLVMLPNINFFERISAAVNVLTYAVNPFIFVATIWFFKALATHPTMLMLYLSIIMLIPLTYIVLIPIFVRPLNFREALYFYGGMLLFLSAGTLVNLATYFYSLSYMDEISWGKTRRLQIQQPQAPAQAPTININLMNARESYV